MKTNLGLELVVIVSALVFANGACPAETELSKDTNTRPNIVFIFSDDHACHAIGAYGGILKSMNPTPNIDRLARQGMLFQNSFCTNSICGPSRAVILTGKFSHLNGFRRNGDQFDGSQQTFPKLMQSAGYQTAIIGKWHLGTNPQGFDHWDILRGQGDYYNPVLLNSGGERTVEGYCTDVVTELSLTWLKKNADSKKPFMLMCQHKAPHRTWMPAIRHLTLYDELQVPEPATMFDRQTDNAKCVHLEEMELDRHMDLVTDLFAYPKNGWEEKAGQFADRSGTYNKKKMTTQQLAAWNAAYDEENLELIRTDRSGEDLVRWKYQRYIKNYLRCVRGVDDSVGQIMSFLKQNDLEKNTILIYSSDQGFYLGDHGWFDKRFMYEESLKMPLIVSWPGVTQDESICKSLVQNIDYAPTFLEIGGAPIPEEMQGESLVPLLKQGHKEDWRKSIYYHYFEFPGVHMVPRHYGIRDQRFKLIHFYQFDEWELYDLINDPDELSNQYSNPNYKDKIIGLKQELTSLREKYRDDSDISVGTEKWQQEMFERNQK